MNSQRVDSLGAQSGYNLIQVENQLRALNPRDLIFHRLWWLEQYGTEQGVGNGHFLGPFLMEIDFTDGSDGRGKI